MQNFNARQESGINGDFLCAKGRFGFDFVDKPRKAVHSACSQCGGACLSPQPGNMLFRYAGEKLKRPFGTARVATRLPSIGSNLLLRTKKIICCKKFARTVLHTNNIDHERTTDYPAFARALAGQTGKSASLREIAAAHRAFCSSAEIPTEEHPLLALDAAHRCAPESRSTLRGQCQAPSSSSVQAKATLELRSGGYDGLANGNFGIRRRTALVRPFSPRIRLS